MQETQRDKMIHRPPEHKMASGTEGIAITPPKGAGAATLPGTDPSPIAATPQDSYPIATHAYQNCPQCGETGPLVLNSSGRWAVECLYCKGVMAP